MFTVHKDGGHILVTDRILQKKIPLIYLVSSFTDWLSIFMD
jgi:hypothetical protein